jgi:hypothetical protein
MISSLATVRVAVQIPTAAIIAIKTTDAAQVAASTDFAPSTRLSRNRPMSTDPATPGMAPAAIVMKPWRRRIPRSRTGVEPSAMRTPISWVL